MPEDTGATGAQGATAAQPQGGAAQAQGADAQQAQGASAGQGGTDVADLRAKIELLEKDNAKYRSDARKRDEVEKASADKAKTLEERLAELEKTNAALASERTESGMAATITAAATRLGFRNPELAGPLIRTKVQLDDDGRPTNVDALLKSLLKDEPYLGRTRDADFGGGPRGDTPADQPGMNELLRAARGR